MKMRYIWFFLFIGFTSLSAQEVYIDSLPRFMLHGSFNVGVPQGFVKQHTENAGIGFNGEFLYRMRHNKPFLAGLSVTTVRIDSDFRNYVEVLDGEIFDARETTTSNVFNLSGVFRFHPEINSLFQPYVQGILGWNFFYTTTRNKDIEFNENFNSYTNSNDIVLSYGGQIGLQIIPNIYYVRGDIRVGYLRNASVDFMSIDESMIFEGAFPVQYFEEHTSPVDFLTIQVGVTFLLSK